MGRDFARSISSGRLTVKTNADNVTLADLGFSAFVYRSMTGFNESLKRLRDETGGKLDLFLYEHRRLLIRWLNKWGCRQFALKSHQLASENILTWYNDVGSSMISSSKHLWELSEEDFEIAGSVYASLTHKVASNRERAGQHLPITVGPTGASKVIFALQPQVFVPWDELIRKSLGCDGGESSYVAYLREVRAMLESIGQTCRENGFELVELPQRLGFPDATLPQLIGEYFWVTLTRRCRPPDGEILRRWAKWSKHRCS